MVAVIIDQHNGEIRGLVGHRGAGVFRGFNYATKLKRQPGSSFKPLAVYGPALEQGYTPDSVLPDIALNINGYQPQNYDKQTRGDVTLKEAIAKSYNIPAVWLLNEIGIDSGMDFVAKTGLTLPKEDRKLLELRLVDYPRALPLFRWHNPIPLFPIKVRFTLHIQSFGFSQAQMNYWWMPELMC